METDVSINDAYTRFTNIINCLESLEKSYTNVDLVNKNLRDLPKSWEPKVTGFQEVKDLKTLPLEQLLRFFITHEMLLGEDQNKKKQGIALKATTKTEEEIKMNIWLCLVENSNVSSPKNPLEEEENLAIKEEVT